MSFPFDRRWILAAGLVAALLVFWGGMKYGAMKDSTTQISEVERGVPLVNSQASADPARTESAPVDQQQKEPGRIKVYVTGYVSQSDVYEFDEGARVYEAVQKAGPLDGASVASLGMARKLKDGETIYVCWPGESLPDQTGTSGEGSYSQGTTSGSLGPVNINTASADELDARLPGIGPALAARIVDYRTNNGAFKSIEQLKDVSGIGEKKYQELKDLVTVD